MNLVEKHVNPQRKTYIRGSLFFIVSRFPLRRLHKLPWRARVLIQILPFSQFVISVAFTLGLSF
jgi:hypothetical protein